MVEDNKNPYAPPVESADAYVQPPPDMAQGGLSISAHGWATVESMAKWMRIFSTLLYVAAAFVLIGGCQVIRMISLLGGGWAAFSLLLLLTYAVLLVLGATWLRKAANHFYHGVMSDHESPLALGFRNLRLYLILYGIFAIIGLIGKLAMLAKVGG